MRNLLIQVDFETLLGSSPLPEEIQGLHGHPHAVYVIIIRQSMYWLNAVEERETIKQRVFLQGSRSALQVENGSPLLPDLIHLWEYQQHCRSAHRFLSLLLVRTPCCRPDLSPGSQKTDSSVLRHPGLLRAATTTGSPCALLKWDPGSWQPYMK